MQKTKTRKNIEYYCFYVPLSHILKYVFLVEVFFFINI